MIICVSTHRHIYIYIGCLTHIYIMSRNNMAVKFSHLKTRRHLCKEIRQINSDVNQSSSPGWKNQDEIMSCFPSSLHQMFSCFHVCEPTVPEIPLRALFIILGSNYCRDLFIR